MEKVPITEIRMEGSRWNLERHLHLEDRTRKFQEGKGEAGILEERDNMSRKVPKIALRWGMARSA